MSLSPRLFAGEDVLLVEAEKYHDTIFYGFYTLVHRQEGENQNINLWVSKKSEKVLE